MAMPQDSPWINHFNKEIKSVFQAGLIGKWKQVNFINKGYIKGFVKKLLF